MIKILKIFIWVIFIINISSTSFAKENFYAEGVKFFQKKKYEEAKFLFERNIVLNPKHSESYLFLAKIYSLEKNLKEEEKNLKTSILLDPTNEEATYMLMEIKLKKSNYSKVKELSNKFEKICKNLCEKNKLILESLKSLESKNES